MSRELSTSEILPLIPHRYPFLLVDKVSDYEEHKSLTAHKNVTINEPFFQGHFPGDPIMPGVLILEALAQACGILCSLSLDAGEGNKFMYYFGGIDNARFKTMVKPGDTLDFNVSVVRQKRNIWKMRTEASIKGELACSADLISALKRVPI